MDKAHKTLIRRNLIKLSDELRPHIDIVTRYLRQELIISRHMEEDILYQRTPSDKAFKLLDLMPTRGPNAFNTLYDAAVEYQLWEAANILEPSRKAFHKPKPKSPTIVTSSEEVEEEDSLPDEWPNEDHLKDIKLLTLKVRKVQPNQSAMLKFFNSPREDIYKMNFDKKGKVFIIENRKFENGFSERIGSEKDSKGLHSLFQELGFDGVDVKLDINKTKQEMVDILEESFTEDYSNCGCYILFILSHGGEGTVYGTDTKPKKGIKSHAAAEQFGVKMKSEMETGDTIKIKWIEEKLYEVKTLHGKPKLLFIQACQGDKANRRDDYSASSENSPVHHESSRATTNSSASMETQSELPAWGCFVSCKFNLKEQPHGSSADSNNMDVDLAVDKHATDSVDGSVTSNGRPKKTDVIIFNATKEGNMSFRNTAFGSWFIQAVIYVFANFAYKDEIAELIRKVNKLVSKAISEREEVQACEMNYSMLDKFYFFPGLSNDSN